jgi:hypothetical protein
MSFFLQSVEKFTLSTAQKEGAGATFRVSSVGLCEVLRTDGGVIEVTDGVGDKQARVVPLEAEIPPSEVRLVLCDPGPRPSLSASALLTLDPRLGRGWSGGLGLAKLGELANFLQIFERLPPYLLSFTFANISNVLQISNI